jgi:hypothetical protein
MLNDISDVLEGRGLHEGRQHLDRPEDELGIWKVVDVGHYRRNQLLVESAQSDLVKKTCDMSRKRS